MLLTLEASLRGWILINLGNHDDTALRVVVLERLQRK